MADTDQTTSATPRIEPPPLPADAVPIVAMRNVVLFPGIVLPVTLGREESIAAAQEAVRSGRKIGLLLQRDPTVEKPAPDGSLRGRRARDRRPLCDRARMARITWSAQGESRFRVQQIVRETPFLAARIETLTETEDRGRRQVEARAGRSQAARHRSAVAAAAGTGRAGAHHPVGIDSPSQLADLIVSFMDVKAAGEAGAARDAGSARSGSTRC